MNRGLGEPSVRTIRNRLGRAARGSIKGRHSMENTLLIGLSRQVTLERQMDVVANNVANVNTQRLQGRPLAVRGIPDLAARMKTISPAATAASAIVQDRGTFKDFAQGAVRADQEPARRRDRRQRLPRGADPGRRALHPRRRTADQQPGPARQRLGLSGARRLRPDRVPADRQGNHHRRRRQRHRGRRHQPDRLGARQAAAGQRSPTRRSW